MGKCTSGSFIGILGSLAIVTLLYMAVSLGITGTQSYTDIDPADAAPLATAFDAVGVAYLGKLVAIGACIGLTVMVIILRRPRPDLPRSFRTPVAPVVASPTDTGAAGWATAPRLLQAPSPDAQRAGIRSRGHARVVLRLPIVPA